jgi:hypothetical protein
VGLNKLSLSGMMKGTDGRSLRRSEIRKTELVLNIHSRTYLVVVEGTRKLRYEEFSVLRVSLTFDLHTYVFLDGVSLPVASSGEGMMTGD